MADGGDTEPGGQIHIDVAVDVEHVGAEGFLPQGCRNAVHQGVDRRRLGARELEPQGRDWPGPGGGQTMSGRWSPRVSTDDNPASGRSDIPPAE